MYTFMLWSVCVVFCVLCLCTLCILLCVLWRTTMYSACVKVLPCIFSMCRVCCVFSFPLRALFCAPRAACYVVMYLQSTAILICVVHRPPNTPGPIARSFSTRPTNTSSRKATRLLCWQRTMTSTSCWCVGSVQGESERQLETERETEGKRETEMYLGYS